MASLYKSSDGRWTVQWSAGRDRHGKTVRDSRTFKSEDLAFHFKVEQERRGTGTGKESLISRADTWVDHRLGIGKIGEKTAVGYRERIAAWGRLLGDRPYKKLTSADIESAYGRLAAGDTPTGRIPSARTLNHYKSVIRAFFNAMEKASEIDRNPTRALESPNGLDKRTRRAPSRTEMQSILDEAEASRALFGQIGFILRLSSHLGLRRGEIAALRWSDLDLVAMTASITRAATQPTGREVYFKTPKSTAGIRNISMLEPTVQLLHQQRKRVAAWRLKAGRSWADNDLVFCDPFGQVLDLEEMSRSAGRIRDAAQVSREVSPLHGTRHYNLTQLHKAGVDSVTIKTRAGHADIRSTVGYITVDDEEDRKAAEAARGALL
ncbi:Integrase [Shimia thalassica]|uniref:Integrase n=1 Tax=Shimia thalassica TaxID=1715693 RepID=A0A0P1I779_9RHOB|nr:site-specific integrase [Shimia thalassica]CUJ94811.1 Integrase [Shimia thalassica]